MKTSRRTRLAFILFLVTVSATAIVILIAAIENYVLNNGGMFVGVLCGTLGIPGSLFMLTLWLVFKKKDEEILGKIAEFITMSRRTSIKEISENFGISTAEAENIVKKAIKRRKINATLTSSGIIYTPEGERTKNVQFTCPHCGAIIKGAYLPGETVKCPNCGNEVSVVK